MRRTLICIFQILISSNYGFGAFTTRPDASGNGLVITGGSSDTGSRIIIPEIINGLRVTEIAPRAYGNNQSISEVIIPRGVTRIGFDAFLRCRNLAKVVILGPEVYIERAAFMGCRGINTFVVQGELTVQNFEVFHEGVPRSASFIIPSYNADFYGTTWEGFSITVDNTNPYFIPLFQIIEGNFTWQEAKADAEAKGGRLAVLDTQEKIYEANAYLEDLGEWPVLWIGATDEANEKEWLWITDEPVTITPWGVGENGDGDGEDYAAIWHNNPTVSQALTWGDWSNEGGSSQGGRTGSYLLEILVAPPAPPVVELESFYESNPQEEIILDATPSAGFPIDFTYQWSFNDQPIPSFLGGTLPTFNLLGDQSQDGTWKVVVSNIMGTTEASFEYRMFVDNDSDGLSNYREENITLTNPDLADSDADGLSDPDELSIHGTDPNVADVDEDGLNDSEEIAATTDPSVADTDNDGLLDGAEVNTYASNPRSGDTDNDGIADAAEVAAGLDINTAESIADAVAFLTQELANRPPVDGFEEAVAAARTLGQQDVTTNPSEYNLYDAASYQAVVDQRDARPTVAEYAAVLADRDSRPSLQAYNAVVADRDSRPTREAYDTAIAERDARPTLEEVRDGRLGSVLLIPDAATNKVTLRFCIEESDELGQWITREEQAEVEIPLDPDKKFFRFSVKEDE